MVRAKSRNKPIKLHQIWDDFLGSKSDFRDVRNVAIKLANREDLAADKMDELKAVGFDRWALESVEIAKQRLHERRAEGQHQHRLSPGRARWIPDNGQGHGRAADCCGGPSTGPTTRGRHEARGASSHYVADTTRTSTP